MTPLCLNPFLQSLTALRTVNSIDDHYISNLSRLHQLTLKKLHFKVR